MCKKLIVLVLSLCLISSAGAETVKWDFENGNDHHFILQSTYPAAVGIDDPNIAGDEAITGAGGFSGLPDNGIAWTVGPPNQFDGLIPVVEEGCHIVNGVLEYGPCNDPFGVFDTDPPSYVNSRGQSSYLNTYNLSQWGDNLHSAANDQIATSRRVLLGEEAKLTVWSLGGGSGTHAPEYDPNPAFWYTDGSSGIAVISAEVDDQYAILATLHLNGKGTLTEDTLDLSAFAGKHVFIDVVDAFAGSWGWLVVDEIQITEKYGQAAMIVNPADLSMGFDQAQKDRLESLGYEVTVVQQDDVTGGVFTAADAETYDVLVVSETIGSSAANNLIGANVPMMHQESYGWSRHFFTAGLAKTWLNDPAGEVNVVNDAHPIALIAGLSAGQVAFFNDPTTAWTTDSVESLVAGAVNIAQITNSEGVDYTIIFAIEAGTELADPNMVAANRIVGFSLPGNNPYVAGDMTYDAWALFDAAINWLDPRLPEMLAYYAMDGDATDGSGNGNDGVIIGDPGFVDGVVGQAMDLDGDGDYIDCGANPLFGMQETNEMTVAAWVNVRSIDYMWTALVAKGEYSWRFGLAAKWDPILHFGIGWGLLSDTTFFDGVTAFGFDEWHHAAAVFDGANMMLYLDGALDNSVPTTEKIGTKADETNVLIGENPAAAGRYWNGLIDEVLIYNRALSEAEIAVIASQ